MNTKAALGFLAAIILLVVAFFSFNHPANTPVVPVGATATATGTPKSASTTAPVSKSSPQLAPALATNQKGTAAGTITQPAKVAAFTQMNIITSSARPTITGTSNTLEVALVINNAAGVGIAGAGNIPVINGHWNYTAPIGLTPGNYTLLLNGGANIITAHLTVTGS